MFFFYEEHSGLLDNYVYFRVIHVYVYGNIGRTQRTNAFKRPVDKSIDNPVYKTQQYIYSNTYVHIQEKYITDKYTQLSSSPLCSLIGRTQGTNDL